MEHMFSQCKSFGGKGIGAWDTSSVLTTEDMFYNCPRFTGKGIGAWDTSSVVNMRAMFTFAEVFNEDLRHWTISTAITDKPGKCMWHAMFAFADDFDLERVPVPLRGRPKLSSFGY